MVIGGHFGGGTFLRTILLLSSDHLEELEVNVCPILRWFATQDRLICIPGVSCSDLARNDSVVRNRNELSDVLDICNRSPPCFVVLTKMSDRRQYDYPDNECYKKMDDFSAYYSLIFLAEAAILLAISNFWQKYPNSASALAHCEHLLSQFTKG